MEKFSRGLQEKLDNLTDTDTLPVIIHGTIDKAVSVDNGYTRTQVIEHVKNSARSIIAYFGQHGIAYKGPGAMGSLFVSLTPAQIRELAQQEYVKAILDPTTPIELIRPVKRDSHARDILDSSIGQD